MPAIEYGPGGVFALPKYGKYQHRFKTDMGGHLLWPLCWTRIAARVRWVRSERNPYTPMCPQCEERFRQASWLPLGEGRAP